MDPEIHDNAARHRYELVVDGVTAYVLYRRAPGVITFIHTEVPEALGGKGIGSRLARHVLEAARAINDLPMEAAQDSLAKLADRPGSSDPTNSTWARATSAWMRPWRARSCARPWMKK